MNNLKDKIKNRLEEDFYGSKVNRSLHFLSSVEQELFISEGNKVYQRTIDYLSKYYDFDNSPLLLFAKFSLK